MESGFKDIQELSKAIEEKTARISDQDLGDREMNELIQEVRELYDRLIILKYKLLEEKERSAEGEYTNENKTTTAEEPIEIPEEKIQEEEAGTEEEMTEGQKEFEEHVTAQGHQTTLNEDLSGNFEEGSLAEKWERSPIDDLRRSIGINQRFRLIDHMFEGDAAKFDNILDNIEAFSTSEEATSYVEEDLKSVYGWDLEDETVQEFLTLVKRRFL